MVLFGFLHQYIFRISAVVKVETDIASITVSLIGKAFILVIMYVKSFSTGVLLLSVTSCVGRPTDR
jgi:hypothetical protein